MSNGSCVKNTAIHIQYWPHTFDERSMCNISARGVEFKIKTNLNDSLVKLSIIKYNDEHLSLKWLESQYGSVLNELKVDNDTLKL